MAIKPVTDLTAPMNVGYEVGDTAPIIHSIRWRQLPSRYIYTDVGDVITYHNKGPLVIKMASHVVSYLDIYFLRSANISKVELYLRYMKESDGSLAEEQLIIGEGGKNLKLVNDPINPELKIIKGIAFTQKDLGDSTPMYNFLAMADEGIYQVWVKVTTAEGNKLHTLIPFVWSFEVGEEDEDKPEETTPTTPSLPATKEDHMGYDEYYVTIVEGQSAFTKRPSTHFRMAAIAMLEKPFCFERIDTPSKTPVAKPSDKPIIGDTPASACMLAVAPSAQQATVGETTTFKLTHGNTSGILRLVVDADVTAIADMGDGAVRVEKSGTFPINFIVTYNDGQECKVSATVTGIVPVPEPAPAPEPEPTPPKKFTCDLSVTGTTTVEVGKEIKLTLNEGENSGGTAKVNAPSEVTVTGSYTFTSSKAGAYAIEFEVTYPEGVCKKTVNIEFKQPEKPADGHLLCGTKAESSNNYGEYIYDVTEEGIYFIDYNFYALKDRMYVYAGSKLIYDTGSRANKEGSPFGFHYKPSDGKLKVIVNDKTVTSGTSWDYTLYCPSNVPWDVATGVVIN